MKKRVVLAAIAVSLTFPALVRTQEQGAPSQDVPQISSNSRPASGDSAIDTQGIKNYLLGPGDTLDVRVFGQSDLNAVVEVDSEGNISSLPFLEAPIPAKCRTEKEIQKDIVKAYGKYIKNPQVSVHIVDRKSRQPATVFGAVRQPTRLTMQRRIRLNELVVVSGGFTDRASGTIQIFHTEPLMCPQPGEEALAAPIDDNNAPFEVVKISELRSGKGQANPIIRPGDYVMVTEAEPVYIMGSVVSPQGIYLRDRLTLSMALAMVGGARKEAKVSDVHIYRRKPDGGGQDTIRVDYAAIKKNQKPDFLLQPFDIIEVSEAGIFSGPRIVQTLLGAVSGGLGNMMTTGGTSIANKVVY
ncbi:MAG: polysaccharide biosynthesis/export family protein [Pyrinomonadaceae bacterium]